MLTKGGRALKGLGPIPGYQPLSNSEYPWVKYSSESVGDKLHWREGNSPDQQLRCLNSTQWKGGEVSQTVRMLA